MRTHSISAVGRFPVALPPPASPPIIPAGRCHLPGSGCSRLRCPCRWHSCFRFCVTCWPPLLSDGLKAKVRKEKVAQLFRGCPKGGDHASCCSWDASITGCMPEAPRKRECAGQDWRSLWPWLLLSVRACTLSVILHQGRGLWLGSWPANCVS